MNPIVYAIPIFMLSILLEAWLAHRRGLLVYDIPDAVTSLHFGVLSQVAGTFTRLLSLGIYVLVFEQYRAFEWPADRWWSWALALLLYDFLYYWVHRFGHEVNLMWAAHQVHHSSEYFNLTTALRQTATGAFFGWPFYLPMAVLGVPPLVFVGVALIDLLYQYWVHTELIGRLGWLDRVVVTPSNHRVHHGQNDYCIDRNYGGILILWDRIFGTFAAEHADEKIVYGIRKPLASFNPLWGNLNVYRDIWQAMRRAANWRAAIAVAFAPPGGWHQPLPQLDSRTCRRYSTGTSLGVRRYAVLHYGIMVVYVSHFLAVADVLDDRARLGYALLILLATVSLGLLLEARAIGRHLESLRVLIFAGYAVLAPDWFGWSMPLLAKALLLVLALSSVGWLQWQAHSVSVSRTPPTGES